MKKHASTILILTMLIVGLSVLLYPSISTYINSKNASHVVAHYQEAVDNASVEELEDLLSVEEGYNQRLSAKPDAFYNPKLIDGYSDALDITGTGVMGKISINKIKVELPIYHGTDPTVLQIGVGHIEGSSLPIGGEGTHCVLSGHRGLPSARLFTDLDQLEIGDTFTISVLGQELIYQIDQVKIVLPTETEDLKLAKDQDYCTLVTCTPYGINTHRLLVRGKRVETPEVKPGIRVKNEAFKIDPLIVTPIAAIPLLLILLTGVFLGGNKSKGKRRQRNHTKE